MIEDVIQELQEMLDIPIDDTDNMEEAEERLEEIDEMMKVFEDDDLYEEVYELYNDVAHHLEIINIDDLDLGDYDD